MAEPQQTLYETITRNDIDSVRIQLANNVNPNAFPNNPTITPLILAVRLKYLDIANELLMNGADVNGVDEFGRTALHVAVDNNDEASVSVILSHNCNLEKYDNFGLTPLTLAVDKNNIQMVRYLVAQGAVVYKYLEGPELPPLPFAAFVGRFDILQYLVNVEETDREKKKMNMNFALCLAINNGHNEAAEFLINNGAPISRRQGNWLSPLEFAIIGRNEYMVSYLLSHNASVSDTNHHGFTPLMTSIIFNNPSAAALLLCYGADPDALASGFRTTGEQVAMDMRRVEIAQIILTWKNEFMTSIFEPISFSIESYADLKSTKTAVRVFLASRATCWEKVATCWFVDHCDLKRRVVLASRASLGIFDVLEESVLLDIVGLKEPGQPPVNHSFHKLSQVFTPKNIVSLKEPVDNNDEASVSVLLSHNCNLEKYDNFGLTPLTLAVNKNNIHMVRYLVAQGAVFYKYLEGPELPPLPFAAIVGRFDILQETDREKKKSNMNVALFLANYNGHNDWIELKCCAGSVCEGDDDDDDDDDEIADVRGMLENVGEFNKVHQQNVLPPTMAECRNKRQIDAFIWRKLDSTFVNPNVFPNNPTITPLILAVMLKFLVIANELLMNGADVNGVDVFGRTALHVAVDNDDEASVSILISHNCNLEKYDNDGLTPLTLAVEKNNIYMVRYLVAQGAKVYKFLHENELSPLLYAAFIGRADILQVLLNVEETDRETKKMDMFFALCMTVEKGYLLAAKLLIDYGAPLDRLDEVDLTPLELAILEEQDAMVSLLLSHNAPVNGFNRYGFTPLMISIIHDNPSAAAQLLWYGMAQ
ncbi:unnamed protein product [Rodentolepis nana]|uniref:ANK_REP_REGION domain-containing protein n=1 Tax=Rodentolepis nana TaxID=102285 RepID=A0A0R3TYK1_RODNA|nr:unnamed protein product [Rodentolepis nana]